MNHYNNLKDAREDLEEEEEELEQAERELEDYDYENSEYKQSCSSCGGRWTFSTYDAYMNFYHDHQ